MLTSGPPATGLQAAGLAPLPRARSEPLGVASEPLKAPFAGLEAAPALLLAVSGGPDSLALMLLAHRWAATLERPPRLHVATVDHGLRAASRAEADHVAGAARALDMPHATLPWLGEKPRTRIQERARSARYALLTAQAQAIGASHLLTGHHADDQAETILFRLARGSGLAGLAGMRRATSLTPTITLVRPLLAWRKAALVAVCETAGLAVVDDPSNHDLAFARAKLRANAPLAEGLGLDPPTLARLATRLAHADDALEAEARRQFDQLRDQPDARHGTDCFDASLAPLAGAAREMVVRVLRMIIETVAPDARAPRLDRLENCADGLAESLRGCDFYRGTLGGTRLVLRPDKRITVVREGQRSRGRSNQMVSGRDKPCSWQGE